MRKAIYIKTKKRVDIKTAIFIKDAKETALKCKPLSLQLQKD